METIETTEHGEAVIDRLGSGLRRMVELVADILQEERLVQPGKPEVLGSEPSCCMQQVKGIGAQRAQRELAKSLRIEDLSGPGDLAVAVVQQTLRGSASGQGVFHQHTKAHSEGASSRR